MKLVIEQPTAADNNIKTAYNSLFPTASCAGFDPKNSNSQRQAMVNKIAGYLPCFKVGSGSSHIWISNHKNERLAVIYL